jgi:two-component system chemotaxis sensor kinase CheA
MDVVKTNIERLGGTVELFSRPGQGTTLRMKIPLTLAIIPALIVASAGDRYAIPQAALLEVVRLEGEEQQRIERVQGAPVLRLRGKLLPLAYLDRELAVGPGDAGPAREAVTIVVLQADERSFGLVVDAIHDTEEIVVKPLWQQLKGIHCFAGATVMGDGRVALILDALGIAQRVGMVAEASGRVIAPRAAPREASGKTELVLLCQNGPTGRLAIPLERVARLEELSASAIERVGGAEVAQYRGQILPLVQVAQLLAERRRAPRAEGAAGADDSGRLPVVVFSHDDHDVGLVVDGILDIVEVEVALQRRAVRPGIAGTMIVRERVTEFLDVECVLRAIDPIVAATQTGAGG